MRGRLLSTALALVVSAAALWWLLSHSDLAALLVLARDAQVWQLGLAVLLLPVVQALRAWRFSLMLSGRTGPPSWTLFDVTVRLLVFNFLLPFKLGELSFPLMMRRTFATEYSRSAGVLLLARLMDFGVVAGFLFLAAALVLPTGAAPGSAPMLLLAGVLSFAAPVLAITAAVPIRRAGAGWPRARPIIERLLWGAAMVRGGSRRALAMALTALLWALHILTGWLAASAVTADVPFLAIAMASAASHLAFALPVPAIVGLGPAQAAWSMALHLVGIGWEVAVLTALLAHAVLLCGALGLGLVVLVARIWRPVLSRSASTSQSSPH